MTTPAETTPKKTDSSKKRPTRSAIPFFTWGLGDVREEYPQTAEEAQYLSIQAMKKQKTKPIRNQTTT